MTRRLLLRIALCCLCVFIGDSAIAAQRAVSLSQLDVVDCIVPGAIRQMGTRFTYQEPDRIARFTEYECATMGGTFKIYDPTEPQAVVEHWLPFANAGDAEAQHRLGLIYEGITGMEPDYEKAFEWHSKAAAQGHRGSLYSLSVLYETGRGVPQDIVKAINLYREASGVTGDSLMLSSEAEELVASARSDLESELATARQERAALQRTVADLQEAAKEGADNRYQIDALERVISELEARLTEKASQLDELPVYRMPVTADSAREGAFSFPEPPPRLLKRKQIGRFFALVVGNTHYDKLSPLVTPGNDARSVSALLETKYGFSVELLLDANEEQIKRAINALEDVVKPEDNLLIYFAGHGKMLEATGRAKEKGFWLPSNADPTEDTNWIDNWWITDHLDTAVARRALVIADSCYGGLFSSDKRIPAVASMPELSETDFQALLSRRSRIVLSSGDVQPVVDAESENSQHSVFADALIDVLQKNEGSISIAELYGRLYVRLIDKWGDHLVQEPTLRIIGAAGHEWGDFYFVANK